jgi:hypothetical protein
MQFENPYSFIRRAHTDETRKLFRVEQGMRRCMVCEELFTRAAAAKHTHVACRLNIKVGSEYGCEAQTSS